MTCPFPTAVPTEPMSAVHGAMEKMQGPSHEGRLISPILLAFTVSSSLLSVARYEFPRYLMLSAGIQAVSVRLFGLKQHPEPPPWRGLFTALMTLTSKGWTSRRGKGGYDPPLEKIPLLTLPSYPRLCLFPSFSDELASYVEKTEAQHDS